MGTRERNLKKWLEHFESQEQVMVTGEYLLRKLTVCLELIRC